MRDSVLIEAGVLNLSTFVDAICNILWPFYISSGFLSESFSLAFGFLFG